MIRSDQDCMESLSKVEDITFSEIPRAKFEINRLYWIISCISRGYSRLAMFPRNGKPYESGQSGNCWILMQIWSGYCWGIQLGFEVSEGSNKHHAHLSSISDIAMKVSCDHIIQLHTGTGGENICSELDNTIHEAGTS